MTTAGALLKEEQYSSLVSVDGRTYPLKSASLRARAEGGIAATTLVQAYRNTYTEPLEVIYTLPLPADGAVAGYTIRFGNRVIRAEVKKREEAREEYTRALLDGRAAGLLDQERADTFTQKLGCIPAGETVTVEIEVLQPLAFLPAAGEERSCWEYRFPTVASVRYEGAPGRVPDAEKLDLDRAERGLPVRLEAELVIADGPAEQVRAFAPEQKIKVVADESGARAIVEAMPLNRDVVIRWAAGEQETGARVIEGKGLACDKGRYVLITLTPPNAAERAIPRDLTLLIDCSGSMSGKPLEQAKTVAVELLRSLETGDRFEVLVFSNSVRRLVNGPVDASAENIDDAARQIGALQASGGTEMRHAFIEALRPLRPDSQRQVILLSDGCIGFEREIVSEIARSLAAGARVHVVGVGSAVNRTLSRGAARAGRGVEIIVGLEEDGRIAAGRLLKATVRPVLTDILVEGSALVSCAPRRPRDVFAGQPALIFAEVKREGGSLRVSGSEAGNSSRWLRVVELQPDQVPVTSVPIGALFGREAVEDAEIELLSFGEEGPDAIRRRIETLGLRHGIPSSMTSLVAICEDITVNPKDPRRRERLPVEIPAGVSAEGVGLMPATVLGHFGAVDGLFVTEAIQSRFQASRSAPSELAEIDALQAWFRPVEIHGARVLKLEGQMLIFEFEVPGDGLFLADGRMEVEVEFDDGTRSLAKAVPSESSRPGPQKAGLTVRLALRLKDHQCWHHKAAMIRWRKRGILPVEIRIVLDTKHTEKRHGEPGAAGGRNQRV